MRTKLLVDSPNGFQELIEIGPGGSYFDESRVLWDERKDGPFPEGKAAEVGGLKRLGQELVFDTARKSQHDAALAALEAPKLAAQARRAKVKAIRKAKTLEELREAVAALAELRGEEVDPS